MFNIKQRNIYIIYTYKCKHHPRATLHTSDMNLLVSIHQRDEVNLVTRIHIDDFPFNILLIYYLLLYNGKANKNECFKYVQASFVADSPM